MACAVREREPVVYSNTVSMECDINIMTWTKRMRKFLEGTTARWY